MDPIAKSENAADDAFRSVARPPNVSSLTRNTDCWTVAINDE